MSSQFAKNTQKYTVMGVTRLKRKERKNRAVANNLQSYIKQLARKPILKNVDIEELKKQTAAQG